MESGDISMNTMNHEQALQGQAAERYLLGEMDGPEREAYEEHFFDCAACAEEVKAGAAFARATRDYFASVPAATTVPARKSPEPQSSRSSWFNLRDLFRPAPAFAFSLLLVLATAIVYRNVVMIHGLRAAQVASFLRLSESRGGAVPTVAVQHNSLLSLQIDVPPLGDYTAYEGQIISEKGNAGPLFSIAAPQGGQTVLISVVADELAPGKNILVIRGVNTSAGNKGAGIEVKRCSFELQFR